MDDKLIDNLIQSDEIISKTIEEGNKSIETSVDDILSSVMSISVADAQRIEKETINQATKEAQNIKASLTGTLTTNLPSTQELAKLESSPAEGMVSEETLGNLTSVMSNLEGVLNQITTPKETPKTPETLATTQIISQQFDVDKLSSLVNDFKTISTFEWSSKWLSNVEKIADEVSIIKDDLTNLPTESKLNLGIDEESLNKVQQGVQKVKENIATDLSVVAPQMQGVEEEETGAMGSSFLEGFSGFFKNLYSIPEKSEAETFLPEQFMGSVSNFGQGELKAVQSGISELLPEEFGAFEETGIVESPFGVENILGGLKSTFSSLFGGGEEEEEETPFAITETTELRNFETPTPPTEEAEEGGGGISGFFSSIFGGAEEEKAPTTLTETTATNIPAPTLPTTEGGEQKKSLAELFQMAYGRAVEPEEELEEELIPTGTTPTPKAGVEVKTGLVQPPALIEDLSGLFPEGVMPPTEAGVVATPVTPAVEVKTPPIAPQMPATVPFSLEALTGNILPKMPPIAPTVAGTEATATLTQQTTTPTLIPPPIMAEMGVETPVESLFNFETTGAIPTPTSLPMPPQMEAGMGQMPMPPQMEAGMGQMPMPPQMEAGMGQMPMPPQMEAGMGQMPMPPQAIPMPSIPELGALGVETPVESLFNFETTGAMPPSTSPITQMVEGTKATPTEAIPTPNAPVLEAVEPVETFEDIMRNILKNRAAQNAKPTPTSPIGKEAIPIPPLPPPMPATITSKEGMTIPQNLGAMANEAIPFGGELLPPMPPTIRAEGGLTPPPELSFSSLDMFKGMDFLGGMGIGEGATQALPMPPSELMPFGTGMEDILIKSQSQKSPELSSAISKIQSSEMPETANMEIESQMMMNEVNLEPLSQKLTGSISNLGDIMSTQATQKSAETPTATETPAQTTVESAPAPETETKGGGGMSAISESGISEAQARIIGRQIANEIKSSLAKLYS